RMYAALEVTIALCALVMPAALAAMRPLLAWAYANGSGGLLFEAVRLTVSIVLIAIPAAAMGASFPIGVVAVRDPETGIRDSKNSGSQDAGELYAANTVGAALGAAATGFMLLPTLGLFGTTLVGVALNALAAMGALLLVRRGLIADRSAERSPTIADPKGPRRSVDQPRSSFNHTIALPAMILGVSGFVALV